MHPDRLHAGEEKQFKEDKGFQNHSKRRTVHTAPHVRDEYGVQENEEGVEAKKVAAEDQVVKVNWSGRISKKRFHRKTTRGLQSIQEDITVNEIWEEGHKTIKMNGEEVLLLSSGKKMVGMETWWWNTTVHEAVKAKMKRTRRVTKPKQTKIGKIPRSKEISKESSFNGPWRSL